MNMLKKYSLIIRIILAVTIGVLSFTLLSNIAGSKASHQITFSELEEEKATVKKLLASSTASSAAITLIPDDVGTPIAEQLAGLSTFFLFILSVLYAEKYLLTLIGICVFKVLVPAACCAYIIYSLWPKRSMVYKFLQKLVIIGLIVFHLIPLSAFISRTVEKTYQESINSAIAAAVSSNEESGETISVAETEEKGWFTALLEGVVNSTTGAVEWAKTVLNHFIEATAIMIVTTCLIPLIIFVIILILLKKILNFDQPSTPLCPAISESRKKPDPTASGE